MLSPVHLCLVSSCTVVSCLILYSCVLSRPVHLCLVSSCTPVSCLVLYSCVLSRPVQLCHVLMYSCVLSSPVQLCLVFSCTALCCLFLYSCVLSSCTAVYFSPPVQPYVFGGIINRDNVLQKLLDHGLMNGCEWAVDPPPDHLNKRGLAN